MKQTKGGLEIAHKLDEVEILVGMFCCSLIWLVYSLVRTFDICSHRSVHMYTHLFTCLR